jgi:hypothetical protein
VTPRAAAVKDVCSFSRHRRLVLDGCEHGVTLMCAGAVALAERRLVFVVLFVAPPKYCILRLNGTIFPYKLDMPLAALTALL